jgi:drug/metabolite transporter (DMT)-like permease
MNYILLVMETLIASVASFCFKKSSNGSGLMSIVKNKLFYLGGFLYILSSVITIWLLQRMPYSVILPMGGICYIWTLLISHKFLGEKINIHKILGIILIIIGVVLNTKVY